MAVMFFDYEDMAFLFYWVSDRIQEARWMNVQVRG